MPIDSAAQKRMNSHYNFGSDRTIVDSVEEKSRLQVIINALYEGVVCTDLNGQVTNINAGAEKILGRKKENVLGNSLLSLYPPKLQERLQIILQELRLNPNETSITLNRKIGNRWIEMHFSAIWDQGEPKEIIISLVDETEKKRLKEKQRSLEFELLQEQKLSSIGILASGIAHNLNGPLSVIVGYLDLLYSRISEADEIPLILAQTERMKEIINNMMIKSRQEQDGRNRWLNLNSLLKNELKFLEANLEFKHRVDKQYEFAVGLPEIYGVYSDFSQSFQNIVNNAIDAMVDSPVKNLFVKTSFDSENIYVEFHDTGHGLDSKDIDKIFSPFYSTKPPVGEGKLGQPTGTGLGLLSASQLIKKYGGTIEADGKPGKGACFKITIPIKENLPPQYEEDPNLVVETKSLTQL